MSINEEAKELVVKMMTKPMEQNQLLRSMDFNTAIQCALICVDVMIDRAKENFKLTKELNHRQSEGLMAGNL